MRWRVSPPLAATLTSSQTAPSRRTDPRNVSRHEGAIIVLVDSVAEQLATRPERLVTRDAERQMGSTPAGYSRQECSVCAPLLYGRLSRWP
jgi:hypothetical protein